MIGLYTVTRMHPRLLYLGGTFWIQVEMKILKKFGKVFCSVLAIIQQLVGLKTTKIKLLPP